MAGALEGDTFIGTRAQAHRGLLKLRYPMEHGVVTDWDDMERIWSHVYTDDLRILSEEHPVLLTEAPLNPRANREQAAQIFFETFNVPALHLAIQAVLSLYASGRTSGLVLDSGDGVSHAVPVAQGFAIDNAIMRVDVAGRDVTNQLQTLLRRAGVVLTTSAEREIVREIKERACYLAIDPRREEKEWATLRMNRLHPLSTLTTITATTNVTQTGNNASGGPQLATATDSISSTTTTADDQANPQNIVNSSGTSAQQALAPNIFRLPDGRELNLGAERFRAPEILFSPHLIGSEEMGLHELVSTSISRTDLDLRSMLHESIVLSGGSTLTRGFGDRLLHELKRSAQPHTKIKIYAPPERKYSTWIGGSILAGLSTFKKLWVSVDEWHENPDIIHTKCM